MSKVNTDAFVGAFSYMSSKDIPGNKITEKQKKRLATENNINRVLECIPGISLFTGIQDIYEAKKQNPTFLKTEQGKAFIARIVLNIVGLGGFVLLLDVIGTIMKTHLNRKATQLPKNSQKV